MEGDKMIKETKDGIARRIFDGEGFKKEPCQGYFVNKIINISRRLKITKERFKLSF